MLRSIAFTGHMVDLPGRDTPRFPAALEGKVREAIIGQLRQAVGDRKAIIGVASGARGGDILFHEACRGLGLRSHMVLPFAPEVFVETSVEGVPGGDWVRRFWDLWRDGGPREREVMDLAQTDEAYGLCNSRIIEMARRRGAFHLIALWDGEGGDGPGGTADMVAKARAAGDEPAIIDPGQLLIGRGK